MAGWFNMVWLESAITYRAESFSWLSSLYLVPDLSRLNVYFFLESFDLMRFALDDCFGFRRFNVWFDGVMFSSDLISWFKSFISKGAGFFESSL